MPARPTPKTQSLGQAGLDCLLPDEDPDEFIALRDSLVAELAPATDYQRRLAISLVMVEWEIQRHRRLMAAAIRDEFRRSAGALPKPDAQQFKILSDDWAEAQLGRDLLAGDKKALADLKKWGVTLPELSASAFSRRFTTVAYHEGRIADLERRRRLLRPEYEALKARRPPNDDIEDAVEVE